ncbi:glutamate--tRNA ligase [Candidatus Berkelbacteria bacterium]|nr:glutamate--tRNA ligase [Candidatus Berkelbacteria bacterium]
MKKHASQVRVRFAPSPTGELHLGSARTALYNFLFAKKNQGVFIIRIEDTDQKRYVPGSMERFFKDLAWLGLKPDEGPYIQSERRDRHLEVAQELIERGAAYYDFSEGLGAGEKHADLEYRQGRGVYRGQDRDLPLQEAKEKAQNALFAIRLKIPQSGACMLKDQVRGKITFDYSTVDDTVLLKRDGLATYHLAAMTDDHDLKITHVFRSEEWLSSTPKHLFIYEAMGWSLPEFAHLPLILAPDGKKLSKRLHGASVWVATYRERGYLPEALINYLALLGWNPGGNQEIFTLEELINSFSLERIHLAGAKFDQEKLDAFQTHYVRTYPIEKLADQLKTFLPQTIDSAFLSRLITISQNRMGPLADFPSFIASFLTLSEYPPELLVFRKSTRENTRTGLQAASDALEKTAPATWQAEPKLASLLDQVVSQTQLANGDVFWPVRVALTGAERSPAPAECLWALGRAKSLNRLRNALKKIC